MPSKYIVERLKELKRKWIERSRGISSHLRDYCKYARYSSTFADADSRSKLQGLIIRQAHAVEVGMIYRPTRPGFATATVERLIDNITTYLDAYGTDSLIVSSVQTLREYCNLNESLAHPVKHFSDATDRLSARLESPISPNQMPEAQGFEGPKTDSFDSLAVSRRSCRDYAAKTVDPTIILDSASVALRSPSACNRQPCRVYIIRDPEKKKRALEIQNNRSAWRNDACILIITGDLGYYQGIRERNAVYVDGGLFSMTLGYSLNAKGIATCMLNLNVTDDLHDELRGLIGAQSSEIFIMMIACGYPASQVLVPKKYHRDAEEIVKTV